MSVVMPHASPPSGVEDGGSEVEVGRFVSSGGFRHHAALRFGGCPLDGDKEAKDARHLLDRDLPMFSAPPPR